MRLARPSYRSVTSLHGAHRRSHRTWSNGRRAGSAADPRGVPSGTRAEDRAGHVVRRELRRQGPATQSARRSGADTAAGARRGLCRRDGQQHQLQHGVEQHLRAGQHVRAAGPPGPRERVGATPRPAVSSGRQRCRRRRAARRRRCAQLEGRRSGHGALQLRRRSGPDEPRRLDDGQQPAHLGVRDELRRACRPGRGQGQPAAARSPPTSPGRRRRSMRCATPPATACSCRGTGRR